MKEIPIFYYHSVALGKSPEWYRSFLTLKLSFFEDFIRYLVNKDFKFIFLDEYFQYRKDVHKDKNKIVCFTFDDGYIDNYVFVYPVLKKYGAKATIFVNPDFVQENEYVRPTLEDVWKKKIDITDLQSLGFASWNELRIMQLSGVMDIQSHTMTHTKYFVSHKLKDFHNPKSDYLYPIANLFPQKKPYYITDPGFVRLIPWGAPFFEERSAIVAKRVTINERFQNECVEKLKKTDWQNYSFNKSFCEIKTMYDAYRSSNSLIAHVENTQEYEQRVRKELKDSRIILEEKLGKPVLHCSWPHGEYNDYSHRVAKEEGYVSTTIVLNPGQKNSFPDRFNRMGGGPFGHGRMLSRMKAIYKLNAYREIFPYNFVRRIWDRLKYYV